MISVSDSEAGLLGPNWLRDEMEAAFAADGLLSRSSDFEYRPEQQQMAVAVAEALECQSSLAVEAGTGVGKSLAYLLPALRFAIEEGRKAILSTHTINLQEQLIRKDLPLVRKLIPGDWDAVLLKGRQNYLCPLRLRRAYEQQGDLFGQEEARELRRIWEWAEGTEEGTLSDLDFQPNPRFGLKSAASRKSARNVSAEPKGIVFISELGRERGKRVCWW